MNGMLQRIICGGNGRMSRFGEITGVFGESGRLWDGDALMTG